MMTGRPGMSGSRRLSLGQRWCDKEAERILVNGWMERNPFIESIHSTIMRLRDVNARSAITAHMHLSNTQGQRSKRWNDQKHRNECDDYEVKAVKTDCKASERTPPLW